MFGGGGISGTVNPPQGTAKETVPKGPASLASNIPVLPGVSAATGASVPMLIALGVFAWFLFRAY